MSQTAARGDDGAAAGSAPAAAAGDEEAAQDGIPSTHIVDAKPATEGIEEEEEEEEEELMHEDTAVEEHELTPAELLEIEEKKQHPTFNRDSLLCLAHSIGSDGVKLAMCLNIPTVTIIRIRSKGKANGWDADTIMQDVLLYWRVMKKAVKDKDRASDMQRALEHMKREDIATIIADKFGANAELTADSLPAPPEPPVDPDAPPHVDGSNAEVPPPADGASATKDPSATASAAPSVTPSATNQPA